MSTIDAFIFINLKHRKDRLENIREQLYNSPVAKELPIISDKIHRIEANYRPNCGAAGCAESHVKALNYAINNKWKRVAIFEDDFAWKNDTDYIIKCLKNIDDMPCSWVVSFLSTNKICLKIKKDYPPNLKQIYNAQTTSGYIINTIEQMIKLRDLFKKCADNLNRGRSVSRWSIDIQWKPLQLSGGWFCFNEQLGLQIISYSDVTKTTRNKPEAF